MPTALLRDSPGNTVPGCSPVQPGSSRVWMGDARWPLGSCFPLVVLGCTERLSEGALDHRCAESDEIWRLWGRVCVTPACLQGPVHCPSSSSRGGKPQHGLLAVFSERPGRRTCLQAGTSFWNSTLVDGDAPALIHRDEASGIGQEDPALSWGDKWGCQPPLVSG